jgi:hypothetical protein
MNFGEFMSKLRVFSVATMMAGMTVFALPSMSAELIQNGGFESFGPDVYSITSWNTAEEGILGSVLAQSGTVTDASGRNTVGAASGTFYGLLDAAQISNQALFQTFTTGAVNSATLSFQMFVNNQSANGTQINNTGLDYTTGGTYDANQHVRVDLLTAGAGAFSTSSADVMQSFYLGGSNGNNVIGGDVANPYLNYSFDISSLIAGGGTYTLRFASVANENQMQLGIDNVSLFVTPVPEVETYGMFLMGLTSIGLIRRRGNSKQFSK